MAIRTSTGLTRAQIEVIIRSHLKPDQTPNWRQETPIFHRLFKQYPSVPFWLAHQLTFPLNSFAWFLTEQGQAQLASDWTLFYYVPPPIPEAPVLEKVDSGAQPAYNAPTRAPKTIAEFLKTQP